MARNSREVKVLITGDATRLASTLRDVEGRFGRFGGLVRGALGGAAVVGIGRGLANAANQFKDTALAANDFATASGLSVEEASRWQEVAGDLGVETSTLQSTFARLSKQLGTDRQKFEKYGATVETAADGTVDANKTFLNAVDALTQIENPLERAAAGSEMFGRSWGDVAPLVELGAENLTTALNEVGEAQVINEDEVDKAKQFRDTMDLLNDSTMGLKLTFIEALLPAISSVAGFLADHMNPTLAGTIAALAGAVGLAWAIGKVTGAVQGVVGMLDLFHKHPVIAATVLVVAGLAIIVRHWDDITAAIQRAIAKADEFARKMAGPLYGPAKFINNLFGGDLGKGQVQLGPASEAYLRSKGKATGGNTWGPTLVGEHGPELIWPRGSGAYVSTADESRRWLGRGGGPIINIYPAPGMSETQLARAVVREQQRDNRAAGRPVAP